MSEDKKYCGHSATSYDKIVETAYKGEKPGKYTRFKAKCSKCGERLVVYDYYSFRADDGSDDNGRIKI